MRVQNQRKYRLLYLRLPIGMKLFFLLEDGNERNLNYNFNAIKTLNVYALPPESDGSTNKEILIKFNSFVDEFLINTHE